MKVMKKLVLAFCFTLIFVSAAWCIDPYQVNSECFGPKINGLQLGMKMPTLAHMVDFAMKADFIVKPIGLFLGDYFSKNFLQIDISLTKDNQLRFERIESTGIYRDTSAHEGGKKELRQLLSNLEKLGFSKASIAGEGGRNHWGWTIFTVDGVSRRITRLRFPRKVFKANALTDREFVQEFINAYNIPTMNPYSTALGTEWIYRNPSLGWEVTCGPVAVIVEPIVTQSAFNTEAGNRNNGNSVPSLLDDDDENESNEDEEKDVAVFFEFIDSFAPIADSIAKHQYDEQDIDKPMPHDDEFYEEDAESANDFPAVSSDDTKPLYLRMWHTDNYVLLREYQNESWTGNSSIISFWTKDPSMVFAHGIQVGVSATSLKNAFGNLLVESDNDYLLSLQNQTVVFYMKDNKVAAIAYDYYVTGEGQPTTQKMFELLQTHTQKLMRN